MPQAFPGEDVPDEFSYTEGGPSALVVVPATSVQVHPGEEAPEALSQVLLVDSTLALRSHARRITNLEEYGGYLFLDETGGPVVLDAAGLEEPAAAWLADATTTTMHIVSPHSLIFRAGHVHVAIVALDLLLACSIATATRASVSIT